MVMNGKKIRHEDPDRLHPAADRVVAEQIADDLEQDHEVGEREGRTKW